MSPITHHDDFSKIIWDSSLISRLQVLGLGIDVKFSTKNLPSGHRKDGPCLGGFGEIGDCMCGFFWVHFIPKWLIKVTGPFAILFR